MIIKESKVSYGPNITLNGLVSIFDVVNNECNVSGDTEWQILSYSGGVNSGFTIDSGIYNSNTRRFVLNGTDESMCIPKTTDTQTQWGRTISLLCKPTVGKNIFNNSDSLQLHFTENRKVTLLACPYSHTLYRYNCILMDSNDNITIMNFRSNHHPSILKMDINGGILKTKAMYRSGDFARPYSYGKIVENDGYQWVNSYRGYSKSTSFLDTNSFSYVSNSTYCNSYVGDCDVDDDYVYVTGEHYIGKAFKILKSDYTTTISFGTGTEGSGTDTLNDPRGISVGTNYVFVADRSNHRVMILNKSGMTYNTHLGTTGSSGSGNDKFNNPSGSCVKNGKLYISDYGNNRIQIFNETTLAYLDTITTSGFSPRVSSVNDTYIATVNDTTSSTIKVYKLSDKSLVLTKSFIGVSNGPGGFQQYSAKSMRRKDNIVYALDRNGKYYEIDATGVTFGTEKTHGKGDTLDVAIDDTHFYVARNGVGVYKINKVTHILDASAIVEGSGDGEFADDPRGIEVDDDYVYVADTSNDRIQLLNKSDLSFYSKFGTYGSSDDGTEFNNPYSVIIDDGKLYVSDYSNSKVRVYNQSTLVHLGSYSTVGAETIRILDDELFAQRGRGIYVYDKNTFSLKRSKSFSSGAIFGTCSSVYSFDVGGGKIYFHDAYRTHILDKTTLEMERLWSPWVKTAIADTTINEETILISIVFTDDYKVKIYANGIESNELEYSSAYDFGIVSDYVMGHLYEQYHNIEFDWIAFYNRAITLSENVQTYNALKSRYG